MDLSDPIIVLSLIIDLFVLFDLPLEILLLKTLRSTSVEDFGHVFIRCLNCIIVCNICSYIVHIFISEPSGTLGIFVPFYKENVNILGKIRMTALVVFAVHSEHWNTVLAISRLCAILSPIRFNQIFSESLMKWITYGLFIWTLAAAIPTVTINHTYFNRTADTILYTMKGPTTATMFLNYYTSYVSIIITLLTLSIYVMASMVLVCTSLQSGDRKWNALAAKITLVAVLSNIPKIVWCYARMYNFMEAFIPELKLTPMPLDIYLLLLNIGSVVYAFATSFLMVIFFPRTRQKIIEQLFGKKPKNTPQASTSSTHNGRHIVVAKSA